MGYQGRMEDQTKRNEHQRKWQLEATTVTTFIHICVQVLRQSSNYAVKLKSIATLFLESRCPTMKKQDQPVTTKEDSRTKNISASCFTQMKQNIVSATEEPEKIN